MKGVPIESYYLDQSDATLLRTVATHQEPELEAVSCRREQVPPLAPRTKLDPNQQRITKDRIAVGSP